MKVNLFDVINTTEFGLFCKKNKEVQEVLDDTSMLISDLYSGANARYKSEGRRKEMRKRKLKRLAEIESRMPTLDALIVATNLPESDQRKYEQEHYNTVQEKKDLELELETSDAGKIVTERLSGTVDQAFARDLEQWADALGNWYASGVLGPGQVTFRDKVYTAE